MILGISILTLYAIILVCSVLGAKEVHPDDENFYRLAKEDEDGEFECKIYHTNIYMFVGGEIVIMRLYDTLKESDL